MVLGVKDGILTDVRESFLAWNGMSSGWQTKQPVTTHA